MEPLKCPMKTLSTQLVHCNRGPQQFRCWWLRPAKVKVASCPLERGRPGKASDARRRLGEVFFCLMKLRNTPGLTHTYVYLIHIYTFIHIYTHLHVYIYTCIFIYAYIYIHMYIYIYKYIHAGSGLGMLKCVWKPWQPIGDQPLWPLWPYPLRVVIYLVRYSYTYTCTYTYIHTYMENHHFVR